MRNALCPWRIAASTLERSFQLYPVTHFFRSEGFTALHAAAQYGDLDVVQLLVSEGADVNAVALK